MKQEIKIGDHVHVGHMVKGGAGARGVVTKIGDDGSIIFKSHEDKRTFRGRIQNATLEKEVAPRNESTEIQEADLEESRYVGSNTPYRLASGARGREDDEGWESERRSSYTPRKSSYSSSSQTKHYHNVPFAKKEDAKAEGMRFDGEKKKWYHTDVHKSSASKFPKLQEEVESVAEDVESVEEGRGAYDELARRMGTSSPGFNKTPAGKDREQKRRQEHLKGQMQFTKRMGGLTGPKGKLPEDVERVAEGSISGLEVYIDPKDGKVKKYPAKPTKPTTGLDVYMDPKDGKVKKYPAKQGVAEGFSDSRLVNLPGGNRNRPLPSTRLYSDEEKKKRFDDWVKASQEKRKQQEKKQGVAEEVDLDEAVEVSHDRYMRSHGKKASGGNGNWMFTHKRSGDVDYKNSSEVHSARGTYSDAKKSAQKWAKEHGHRTVYVMESTEQQGMLTFKELLEALKGKQHKLDKNKNGKIDAHDFKLLRKEEHEEGVDLEEGWDDMKKAVAARAAAGEVKDKSKFNNKKYSTGTVYTRKRETFSDEDDAASDKKAEKQQQAASGEAPVKRGRGRPKGSYGSYKARSAETNARAAAKSAASKAASRAKLKEAFDDETIAAMFESFECDMDYIDFEDLLQCEEFDSIDEACMSKIKEKIKSGKSIKEDVSESQLDVMILEALGKDASAGKWISDFIKSDNPRFAGKSKAKRKEMALAAYYAKQRGE